LARLIIEPKQEVLMRVGDLVRYKTSGVVGIVTEIIPDFFKMVAVLWADGKQSDVERRFIEVINESR
tara:strand:- start:313 stop:513 length:201 start_codon:yes stop_codon:yes gene_type:complete